MPDRNERPVRPSAVAGPEVRVLAVDDDPTTLRVMQVVLEREGYAVSVGASGGEALELAGEIPDLILLDQHLPDMNGLDVCRQLQAEGLTHDIPVIFLTGDVDPDLEAKCLAAGAVDFVTKPFADGVLLARIRTHLALSRKTRVLERLANTDQLTGVANRRYFDQAVAQEWARTCRSGTPVSLILVDVDHFKSVNDEFGHPEGDQCLRALTRIIKPHLKRPFDLMARLGGEEFAVLLPETSAEGAFSLAEAMRADVQAAFNRRADERGSGPRVTASFGCATALPSRTLQPGDLIRDADEQLYLAKARGRNRVEPRPEGEAAG